MTNASASGDRLEAGELEIGLREGLVRAGGRVLMLSVREFELLAAMARRAGTIITRDELFACAWRRELRPGDRSVDVYVSKLRSKLEAAVPDRRFIHTHHGFGYRFQPEPTRAARAVARADSRVLHTGAAGSGQTARRIAAGSRSNDPAGRALANPAEET